MRRAFFYNLLLLTALLANFAQADFICRSDVSYKWKKAKAEAEVEVYYSSVERTADTEAKAKGDMTEALSKEKVRAFESCKKDHEDLASCVSSKFTFFGSTLQTMGFSARKALEDAISTGCGAQQGECSSSTAADPKCEERVVVEPGAEKDAAKGKKDDKSKEKKK